MYHAGVSRSRAKKTGDPIADPLVDSSTEYKENTPEHSANTSTENSQTSPPLTGSEGGGEEIQSTQPVRKGDSQFQLCYPHNTNTSSFLMNSSFMYYAGMSRSRPKKTRDPVVEDSADSGPVRRATRSTRR
jgi:condensin complex subunit 1